MFICLHPKKKASYLLAEVYEHLDLLHRRTPVTHTILNTCVEFSASLSCYFTQDGQSHCLPAFTRLTLVFTDLEAFWHTLFPPSRPERERERCSERVLLWALEWAYVCECVCTCVGHCFVRTGMPGRGIGGGGRGRVLSPPTPACPPPGTTGR